MSEASAAARRAALALLGRREYAATELRRKLESRGHREVAAEVVAALAAEGLQSDRRYVESLVRARASRGHGPQRIADELRSVGLDAGNFHDAIHGEGQDWNGRAAAARRKRFGAALPVDFEERMRQRRFLEYRGYDAGQIRHALAGDDTPD